MDKGKGNQESIMNKYTVLNYASYV